MNFIVYGNEDSPVVPILIYHCGKLKYVCVVSAVDILYIQEKCSGGANQCFEK